MQRAGIGKRRVGSFAHRSRTAPPSWAAIGSRRPQHPAPQPRRARPTRRQRQSTVRQRSPGDIRCLDQQRKPDILRIAQQQLRGRQQPDGQLRPAARLRLLSRRQRHVDRPQQPGNVGDDRDRIGMHEVQQVEAAERERQRAEPGPRRAAQRSAAEKRTCRRTSADSWPTAPRRTRRPAAASDTAADAGDGTPPIAPRPVT